MEFLTNLSKEDADRIAKLALFVIDRHFVFRGDESLLESEGITVGFLLSRQELGIVDSVATPGLAKRLQSTVPNEFRLGLVAYTRVLVVTHQAPNMSAMLDIYRLTSLGRVVLQLGAFTTHDAYIRHLGRTIRNCGFKVTLARYQQSHRIRGSLFRRGKAVTPGRLDPLHGHRGPLNCRRHF